LRRAGRELGLLKNFWKKSFPSWIKEGLAGGVEGGGLKLGSELLKLLEVTEDGVLSERDVEVTIKKRLNYTTSYGS
jgi:hypothetical protein